jgi:hypothetical protein
VARLAEAGGKPRFAAAAREAAAGLIWTDTAGEAW